MLVGIGNSTLKLFQNRKNTSESFRVTLLKAALESKDTKSSENLLAFFRFFQNSSSRAHFSCLGVVGILILKNYL